MVTQIVRFVFELFHLKHVKHEGVRLANVEFPDSVAEHSLNAAQIWYILATMEWLDAERVAAMLVWHDIGETRMGDIHKVWARYFEWKKEIEKRVHDDQLDVLPFGESVKSLILEMISKTTPEAVVAKDADYLEMAFQAKKYVEQWYAACQIWIDNVWKALKTESAKRLWDEMIRSDSTDWRNKTNLKKIPTS